MTDQWKKDAKKHQTETASPMAKRVKTSRAEGRCGSEKNVKLYVYCPDIP